MWEERGGGVQPAEEEESWLTCAHFVPWLVILVFFFLPFLPIVARSLLFFTVSLGLWPQAPKPLEKNREADVLVQDPVCKTFIPRREALKAERDGTTYFFCSEGCLKRFLSSGKS